MWQGTREEAVKVVQEWMTQARRNVIIPYMTTEKMNSVCDAIERLMVPDSQEAMTRERQFAEQMYVCNCDLCKEHPLFIIGPDMLTGEMKKWRASWRECRVVREHGHLIRDGVVQSTWRESPSGLRYGQEPEDQVEHVGQDVYRLPDPKKSWRESPTWQEADRAICEQAQRNLNKWKDLRPQSWRDRPPQL